MRDDRTMELPPAWTDEVETGDWPTEELELDGEATKTIEAAPSYSLLCRAGPAEGQRFVIAGQELLLGRSRRCQIVIGDPSVSRTHLRLAAVGEGVWFRDMGGSNGTLHQGAPAEEGVALPGDRLSCGSTELEVEAPSGQPPNWGEARQVQLVAVAKGLLGRRRGKVALLSLLLPVSLLAALWMLQPSEEEPPAAPPVDERAVAFAHFQRGLTLLGEGALVAAEEAFEEAGRLDPESEEPQRYLSWIDAQGEVPARDEMPPIDPRPWDEGIEGAEEEDSVPRQEGDAEGRQALEEPAAAPALQETPPTKRRVGRRAAVKKRGLPAEEVAAIEALVEEGERSEGAGALASLDEALRRLGRGQGQEALANRARGRLAEVAFRSSRDAEAVDDLPRAVSLLLRATEAAPGHRKAAASLAGYRGRVEALFVEGYSLLERNPPKARGRLEVVLKLTRSSDDLHERAKKWLQTLDEREPRLSSALR